MSKDPLDDLFYKPDPMTNEQKQAIADTIAHYVGIVEGKGTVTTKPAFEMLSGRAKCLMVLLAYAAAEQMFPVQRALSVRILARVTDLTEENVSVFLNSTSLVDHSASGQVYISNARIIEVCEVIKDG